MDFWAIIGGVGNENSMARTRKYFQWKLAQSAELKWWQRYLKDKDVEAYKLDKQRYWKQVLGDLPVKFHDFEGLDVLDAGCGPAGIFMSLPKANVDAVDPLLEHYHLTLKHFDKGDYPWVRFFESSLEDFAVQKQYDVVFCINAINHVADISLCYNKLSEWVKPGGYLIISIDSHQIPGLKHIFRWLPGDILHPHQYDKRDYAAFLTNHGFEMEQERMLAEGILFNHVLQIARKKEV